LIRKRITWILLVIPLELAVLASCSRGSQEVIVYVAHDRALSEPILRAFQADTGIQVRAVYDVEANKTVGLTNRLIAEAQSPRADVFWNNEVVRRMAAKPAPG
jgi:iron(III) transport system substrate-binding protein